MFEQDYIMRQIKEFVAMMSKVLFGDKVERSFESLEEAQRQKAYALVEKMRNGEPREAAGEANALPCSKENLAIGLEFYSRLSDMDDEFLTENDYSLVAARKDFGNFADKYGLRQMTELYFGSDDE